MASPCAFCSKEAAMATRTADARGAGLPWPRAPAPPPPNLACHSSYCGATFLEVWPWPAVSLLYIQFYENMSLLPPFYVFASFVV
jgi:hypothetical protein